MVRAHCERLPLARRRRNGFGSSTRRILMRKKTAPTTREHGQASYPEEGGLIAKGKKSRQSALDTNALDDLSHRTESFRGVGSDRCRNDQHACPRSPAAGVTR